MKLSVVIIAEDGIDEEKLGRAVASVEFADEVIIDRRDKPIEDFAQVRNQALSKAKGEWVLFIDSDEEVTPKLANEISQLLAKSKIGYEVCRQDRFLGRWLKYGETAGVRLLRLAKKDAGKWERPVHERWKVKGRVGELKNPLLHYAHESVVGMLGKIDRYSAIEAEYRLSKENSLLNGYMVTLLEMVIFPAGKFFQNYVFRLGFLDGVAGFIHAGLMAFHSFLVRAKQLTK